MSERRVTTLFAASALLCAGLALTGCGRSQAGNTAAATTAAPALPATQPAGAVAPVQPVAGQPYAGQPYAGAPAPMPADPCPSIGTLAEAKGPIALNGARLIRLGGACSAGDMTNHLRNFADGTRFILVADDLRAGVQPGVPFELRLGPPSTSEAAVIGTVNFYGAMRPMGSGQPHSISFDVTRAVQSLAVSGWPAQGLGVAVAPSGPVAPGADATIGALRLVAQAPR